MVSLFNSPLRSCDFAPVWLRIIFYLRGLRNLHVDFYYLAGEFTLGSGEGYDTYTLSDLLCLYWAFRIRAMQLVRCSEIQHSSFFEAFAYSHAH